MTLTDADIAKMDKREARKLLRNLKRLAQNRAMLKGGTLYAEIENRNRNMVGEN